MSDWAVGVAMGSTLLLKLLLRWKWLFGRVMGLCDQRRRRYVEMGRALLVSVKAEWVSACEGEREIMAEGLWRLRRRWFARSVGLAGTPLLGGGADGKNQGKKGSEGLKVCVGLGEKREEVGEAVAAGGLGFSQHFLPILLSYCFTIDLQLSHA
ncbi:hypothetical protein POTOM_054927 [Populus tomentosa]|uniref:Uncharacterized protein n=1 Tax=Populus tomentosa TaxID=118781 RepID=A0A8X8C5E6_POPTO|nr:hypothetical protein POTOM_054927 [Populus tomentosa]